MSLNGIVRFLRFLRVSPFQREVSKGGAILFPLVYAALYLNQPTFPSAELVPSLLISLAGTVVICLWTTFYIALTDHISGERLGLPVPLFLSPFFFSLSAFVFCPLCGFSDLAAILLTYVGVPLFHIGLLFLATFYRLFPIFVGRAAHHSEKTADEDTEPKAKELEAP